MADTLKPPRPEKLLAVIQDLAAKSDCVVFSAHMQVRMVERDISATDVFRVLQRGYVKGSIRAGRSRDEWVCKVAHKLRGAREAGVVTIVVGSRSLWLKTVEWEDR